jgi:hypothetical protein
METNVHVMVYPNKGGIYKILSEFITLNRAPVSKHIPHKSTAVFAKTFLI